MLVFEYGSIIILGLIIGSFLNAALWRIPKEKSMGGRSQCVVCSATIRWHDLIPLVSFLILRGRCRDCHSSISLQYPLVEAACALLFLLFAVIFFQSHPGGLFLLDAVGIIELVKVLFFLAILLYLFVCDLRWYLLPDAVTIPGSLFALIVNGFLAPSTIPELLLAGGVCGGFFALQYVISKGAWIGGGDIKLGILMGFMLGWPDVLVALFGAYCLGSIVSLVLIRMQKKSLTSMIPLGPFLTLSTAVVLLFNEPIMLYVTRYFTW